MKLVADADIDETWIDKILQKSNPQKTSNSIQDAEKPFQSLEESQDLIIHHNTMIVPRVQLDVASFPREKLIKFFTDIQVFLFIFFGKKIVFENLKITGNNIYRSPKMYRIDRKFARKISQILRNCSGIWILVS